MCEHGSPRDGDLEDGYTNSFHYPSLKLWAIFNNCFEKVVSKLKNTKKLGR